MSADAAVALTMAKHYRTVAATPQLVNKLLSEEQKKGATAALATFRAGATAQVKANSDEDSTEILFDSLRGVKRVVSREDKDNTWFKVAFIIALLCLIIIGILL